MTFGSKGQRSQQYKLGEHVVRCLSDVHTTQARGEGRSLYARQILKIKYKNQYVH